MSACVRAVLFLHAIFAANGASIVREEQSIIRRDPMAKVDLGPAGELMSLSGKVDEEAEKSVPEECNDVFPYGTEGSDECQHNASLIPDDAKCAEAALAMNRTTLGRGGMINPGDIWEQKRPMGCFKEACTQDPHGECFTFNNRDTPSADTIVGTPVCMRKRYLNGTHTPGADVTCPEGYEEIKEENVCRTAGTCRGECTGAEFRILAEKKSKFPFGCFIHHRWGCVYFNEHKGALPTESGGNGTESGGTPICRSKIIPPFGSETPPAAALADAWDVTAADTWVADADGSTTVAGM